MNMHRTRSQTTEIDEILGEQQNVDNVSVDSQVYFWNYNKLKICRQIQTQAQNDLKNAKKLFRVESSCSESSVSENEANIGIVMNKKKPPKESDIENIDMISKMFLNWWTFINFLLQCKSSRYRMNNSPRSLKN